MLALLFACAESHELTAGVWGDSTETSIEVASDLTAHVENVDHCASGDSQGPLAVDADGRVTGTFDWTVAGVEGDATSDADIDATVADDALTGTLRLDDGSEVQLDLHLGAEPVACGGA